MSSAVATPKWSRVVVKLSGEALQGSSAYGLDAATLARIAGDLAAASAAGHQIAVVVGGGNFFRGIKGADSGIERARADSIGMLATVMNGLALEQAIEGQGRPARCLSAVPMPAVCESFSRRAALHHLEKGRVVIAAELSADAVLKATQVDGVYTADPKRDPSATRYDALTHDEAIAKNLAVMDTAAFALARENRIPIIVFSIAEAGAITTTLAGRGRATLVSP